jgi:hypothetical protein
MSHASGPNGFIETLIKEIWAIRGWPVLGDA